MSRSIPYFREEKACRQLIVRDEQFLILGAELHNSSMSSAAFMKDIWPKLKADGVNTVLCPVTWELVEPEEGVFDFTELDVAIRDARSHELHLILLWFGSFKNGMSVYAPSWVKQDDVRFPRAQVGSKSTPRQQTVVEILSVFGQESARADTKAFVTFMKHLKDIDEQHSTVIMVQVQNEVGLLQDSRDRSALAEEHFAKPVPRKLITSLISSWDTLDDCLKRNLSHFENSGAQIANGTWEQVFGPGIRTDEIFMAYHYALYLEQIAAAGKVVYPIPLFTNAWLSHGEEDLDSSLPINVGGGSIPGDYPSGGGVVHVLDIWRLSAPTLEFVSPDIYLNDYERSCAKYSRNQTLFIPEQRRDEYGARRIWKAFGCYQAIGTSPFGIDTVEIQNACNPFKRHYQLLAGLADLILQAQRCPESCFGFFFDELPEGQEKPPANEGIRKSFGQWQVTIERAFVFGKHGPGSGIIMQQAENRFLVAGWGFQLSFTSLDPQAVFTGILSFDEKKVVKSRPCTLKTVRRLNGDESKNVGVPIMPNENPDYGGFPISASIPAGTAIAEIQVYNLKKH